MATFTKVNAFVEKLAEKAHNLGSDQLVVALTNTAPGSESTNPLGDTGGVVANLTQITYTNLSSRNITTSASAQTSGTYKLTLTDLTLTASGGSVGPFRYVYIYNDTATNDELVGMYDYGSSITLADGESIDLDFSDANGLLQVA